MSSNFLSLQRAILTVAALFLVGDPAWAQGQAQTTVTPRAPSDNPAFRSPISPFLFGPPAYPFSATAPSSTTRAPSAVQISGISHAPSLGSTPPPPPLSIYRTPTPTHSQLAIGPFIGFASAFPLVGTDSNSQLPGSSYRPAPNNRAHIWLRVAADAKVWFDGRATTQTGTLRLYDSPELTPGKKFVYEVRIRWMKDGKPIEETRRIRVEAKDWLRFDLTRPSAP